MKDSHILTHFTGFLTIFSLFQEKITEKFFIILSPYCLYEKKHILSASTANQITIMNITKLEKIYTERFSVIEHMLSIYI